MTYNRRLFLRNTGMLASGIALVGIGCANPSDKKTEGDTDSSAGPADTTSSKIAEQALAQFGLQLYTLRDILPQDPKGVLKQVSAMGYKQIEGYEDKKAGMWWGMKAKDFKQYLGEINLTMVSTHCNTKENFERKAGEAAEIGLKYLLSPWEGPQKSADDYKKIADKFNKLGDVCKKSGIRFAYHNHDYSFKAVDGQYPQDIFLQNTNPETMDFEMDIYWVVTAGADPIAWLQKYPNRFRLCHVKDRSKTAPAESEDASVDLGTGSIDFKKILQVARTNGMEYYIVEQEKYDNGTSIKSAEVDANYMKALMF